MSKNHEEYSENIAELTMLRSDISELFQAHADKVAFRQPADLRKPIEVILAGIYTTNIEGAATELEVQIRQRLDEHGTDYLLIVGDPGNYSWCQVADNYASVIYQGEKPMTSSDINALRVVTSPTGITQWSLEQSQLWASKGDLYRTAEIHARRTYPQDS